MKDLSRTNQELLEEISRLRNRIQDLEASEAERKQAEEALRESEEKYRLFVDNAVEAIFVIQDYRLRFVNNKTEELIGYKKEELISKPFIDFIHPDDRALVLDRYMKRQQGTELPSKYTFRVVHRSGDTLWVELNAVVIHWERKIATLNFLIDITERKRSEQEIAILAEIGRVIGSTLNIDEVYEHVAAEIRKLIPFESLIVNLGNMQQETLDVAYVSGLDMPGRRVGDSFSVRGTLGEEVIRTRKGVIFQSENPEDLVGKFPSLVVSVRAGMHSMICVPLISRDEVIGTLIMRSLKSGVYSEKNRHLAERIGMQIAGAIANAQSYANLKRAEQEMAVIAEVGRIIGSSLNIDEVYERFTIEVKKLIGFDRLDVSLHDLTAGLVRVAYVSQTDNLGRRQGDAFPLAGSLDEKVMRTRTGLIVRLERFEEVSEQYPSLIGSYKAGVRSAIKVPLSSHGEVIGCLSFRSKRPSAYTLADLRLAERIGEQIAGAIANATLYRELSETEKSLREQEIKLSSIIRAAPVGIGMVIRRVFQEANDTLCRMTMYSREELLGHDARMLYPTQEDYDYVGQEKYRQIGEQSIGTVETRWKRKDGTVIDIILSSTPLDPNDLAKGVTFTALDITERKQAEKTLQRQNIYLESLNETALGLMRRTDLKDLFQAILDRAMRFFGTDEGWIFIYHFQDGAFEYKAVMGTREYQIGSRVESESGISAEVRRTEKTVLIDDYHTWPKRANGREYDMRRATVAIPLRYEGQLAGILGLSYHDAAKRFEDGDLAMLERLTELASIALDNARLYDRMKLELAERKQAEAENLRLMERLQRSEKMEALGQLAGGVAHDLNNVLGILSGYSELLLLEIPEGHRSRGRVEKILQSTEKAAAIIQDLLTLARRGVMESDVINLNSIVSGFLKTPVFEKLKDYHPRVTLRTEYEKNLLNIKGSPVHLEKTLMNLVSNAVESISGPGEVTIRTKSHYLDKPIKGYDEIKEGDYAVLTVSDTGIGILAENIEKIFEPFYTKKTMGRSGTGLGLTIVWGTVKDHNGYIDVQTEVGQGTTFTLYFPATREDLSEQEQKVPIEQFIGNGESVLVIDDVAEQREVAAGLLTRLGYKVHSVSSGEEAVEYLKGNKADILVLDMIMAPGIDGLETYQWILKVNPKQKAIIVSGFSETERVKKAQKLGAGAYVKKPYILEKIGMAIRDEINR